MGVFVQGPLFKGKGCIRYVWPFCAHQILTHTVVITPAPGKSAAEVEVHMQPSPYLSTFVEFVDTGKLIVVRGRFSRTRAFECSASLAGWFLWRITGRSMPVARPMTRPKSANKRTIKG